MAVLLPVQYREYNTSTKQFTTKTANVVPITADMTTLNNTGISNGWYAVTEDVTISGRINVSGTVNLILCNGKTLTANKGVGVNSGNTLNIYAQSEGSSQGSLSATGADYNSGIGGGSNSAGGNITINGGTVTANGNYGGAGIGGGVQGTGANVTVNGGTVTATGSYTSGIGCGNGASDNGSLTVTGGLKVYSDYNCTNRITNYATNRTNPMVIK